MGTTQAASSKGDGASQSGRHAVYPGTFDPHAGHPDIIERAWYLSAQIILLIETFGSAPEHDATVTNPADQAVEGRLVFGGAASRDDRRLRDRRPTTVGRSRSAD